MTRARACVVVVLMLLGARAAWAQAGWDASPTSLSAPQSTGGSIYAPMVDVDAAGNAVALWTEPGPTMIGTGLTVRTARYSTATGQWSSPQTLSDSRSSAAIDVAVDAAGNALALWSSNPVSTAVYPRTARYDAATGQWSGVVLTSTAFLDAAAVAMNADGDAVVCWSDASAGLYCRRYSSTSATWAAAERIADRVQLVDVALDGTGTIHVVWAAGVTAVRTARFDATAATWGAVVDLATGLPGPGQPGPRVAINDAGDAVATWSRGSTLEASRYPSAGGGWSAAATLSSDGTFNETARAAVDAAGSITVAWTHTSTSARTIQVARYDPMAAAWSPAADLPGQGTSAYGPPSIDVDGLGNVHVVWSQSLASPLIRLLAARYAISTGQWGTVPNLSALGQAAFNSDVAVDDAGTAIAVWFQQASGFSVPQALRWDATPPAPTLGSVVPDPGTLSVSFSLPSPTDPSLAPTALEYSLDDGATWTTRSPASTTSPLVVTGLTDGSIYTLRIRLANAAGHGQPSSPLQVRSGAGIDPTDFRIVSRSGNVATFAWVGPRGGIVPTGYLIEGGISGQSQILASIPSGGTATQITLSVPNGVFFARVVAVHGATRLGQSSALQFSVNAGVFPSAPTNLLGSASGDRLALSWTNTWTGATLTRVRLDVGGTVITAVDLPSTETFTVDGVPPGTYTFAVAPLTGTVPGDYSNVVTLTFPGACVATPNPPTAFSASTQDGVVYVAWLPPTSGPAATSYVVSVSGAFTGSFLTTSRTLAAPVGPGSYAVTIASVGLCGTSTATPAQTVVVP